MNVLIGIALMCAQDDLSEKAKEFLAAMDKIRAGVEEFNRLRSDCEAMAQEYQTASEEKKKELQAKYEKATARLNQLAPQLQESVRTLQRDLERAVTITPDDYGIFDARSQLREILGDVPAAAADLDKALAKKPDHLPYQLRRAAIARKMNQYEDARKRLEAVLKKDPKNATALAEDGLAAFALNDFEGAAKRLEGLNDAALAAGLRAEVDAMLPVARERIPLWEAERKIREGESKADDLPRVRLTTKAGAIEIELFENEAPVTVANFVALTEKKYFDGMKFHRVIANFMVQGGDPNSKNDNPEDDGAGGPGYSFADELPKDKYRRHFRGALSMANSGPNTNGSQFFITHLPTPWLDGRHVVFGRVISGMDVVDRIQPGDVLEKVEVVRKRKHEYRTPE